MANVNNTSSYMDADKKEIIKKSNYTYRDALEVSAYLIEKGKFERFYKEMQIDNLQKELTTKIMPMFLKKCGYVDPKKNLN